MDIERVVYVPIFFLLFLVVVSIIIGAVAGIAVIKSFAITLLVVTIIMFVTYLCFIAAGIVFCEVIDLLKNDENQRRGR